jgi:hypothetical protein
MRFSKRVYKAYVLIALVVLLPAVDFMTVLPAQVQDGVGLGILDTVCSRGDGHFEI